jgi:hypothetical protein
MGAFQKHDVENAAAVLKYCEERWRGFKIPSGHEIAVLSADEIPRLQLKRDGIPLVSVSITHRDCDGLITVLAIRCRNNAYEVREFYNRRVETNPAKDFDELTDALPALFSRMGPEYVAEAVADFKNDGGS